MREKKFFCVCLLAFVMARSTAQVNLQTGSSNFSIPVFSWQDDRSNLNHSVTLSYTSGNGLKVNEVASNVGQGWSLVTGGVITRLQVGEPDDQVPYNGNGSESDIRKYPAGYLFASTPAINGCPEALTKYPIYKHKDQVYTQHNVVSEDKQKDYFSFQFNGKSGMFILDKFNGDVGLSLGESKMKITFERDLGMPNGTINGIRTIIKSFKIQDVDGLIYKFAQLGTTRVLETNYCDVSLAIKNTMPKFKNDKVYYQAGFVNNQYVNPWVVGSWYLSEIEDPLTLRKIFFNYTVRDISNIAGQDITYNWEDRYSVISYKTSITKTPEITSVGFPDGHNVVVNYGAARLDLNGEYAVASIDASFQGRYLSRHELKTSYFILNRYGTPVSDYQKKVARLCLLSVKKIGVDLKEDAPPYKFDYYVGSNTADDFVPPPFFYAKDVWGYYNGNNSTGYLNNEVVPLNQTTASYLNINQLKGLCFIKSGVTGIYLNAKPGYAKNGLLRQIIYPTGGTLTYQYEQNTGVLNGSNTNIGGVHVSHTSSTDGGFSNDCANPVTTQYNYVMNGVGSASSLWGLETPVNQLTNHNHYKPADKKFKWGFSCLLGCCYYKYQYPGILSQNQATSLTDFQKFMAAASPVLGILSVVGTIMDVVNLVCYSSGVLAWVAVILDIVSALLGVILTCFNNPEKNTTRNIFYNTDLNGVSPLPMQFKRVEVVENPGTIGKTVHEFTSSDDYPLWALTNPAMSAKQRFAPWAYGLPKLVTVYDASGNKVKQTQNGYGYIYAQRTLNLCDPHFGCSGPTSQLNCKCTVVKSSSQRSDQWLDPNVYNNPASYKTSTYSDMKVDIYYLYSGKTTLDSSIERVYKVGDQSQYVETTTQYFYHPANHQLTDITVRESNGKYSFKHFTYSSDYYEGVFATFAANNIWYTPVSTTTGTTTAGVPYVYFNMLTNNYFVLNETVTEYTALSNGHIRPSRMIEQRFDKPQVFATQQPGGGWLPSWQAYVGPVWTNYSLYKTKETYTYDALTNLIGVKDEGNRAMTNIYDYMDKMAVASVVNADPVVDKPAYCSFESYGFGGWGLSGIGPVYVNASGITGTRSFNLASNAFSKGSLNTSRAYIVSFWANNSSVIVSGGATLVKSSPTINGFTYYEYDIAQGTSNVSVSGNAYIDELRLYPKTARMRTYTYDPAIGKTSETDENNRITYYEYDNLGRLRFIKDEKSNITKMYEYNNISAAKQNGCPGTFANRMISEVFTRSNCGAGFLGGSVTFTIAANTYTSTISQEHADAQAELALLTNGQAYANSNGSCIPLYCNTVQSVNVTRETCPPGYVGATVTYTVPAGRYCSIVNQADANQQALDEIDYNAQAWANDPANAGCIIDYNPDWEWDNVTSYCLSVNGQLPPHLFILETDMNPNSPTYLLTRWSDVGPDAACPSNTYYNSQQSQVFIRNDCPPGQTGSSVTYTVAPGTYSSTVSQAAANQLAINQINANGQAYANANGTCATACASYTIVVPNSVANDLYVDLWECGMMNSVTRSWQMEMLLDWVDWDTTSATVCIKDGFFIAFRYGRFGPQQWVPEINVIYNGPCP